jgi:hypothetical protein
MPKRKRNKPTRRQRQRGESRQNRNYTRLAELNRKGSVLSSNFGDLVSKKTSWKDERLPEYIWAALLRTQLGQDHFMELIREVLNVVFENKESYKGFDPSLTQLSQLDDNQFSELLSPVFSSDEYSRLLSPLLLFNNLPGRSSWINHIPAAESEMEWNALQATVFEHTDHQSQESTDVRWFRLMCYVLSGQMKMPTLEMYEELIAYPNKFDQRKVRPTVRANENALTALEEDTSGPSPWASEFWKGCFEGTDCTEPVTFASDRTLASPTLQQADSVRKQLVEIYNSQLKDELVNAKNETVFGIAAYAISTFKQLLILNNSMHTIGYLGLRTLLELLINLSYLRAHDHELEWVKFRSYGTGQAKLSFLKFDDADNDLPEFADIRMLDILSNEDQWMEFSNIDVGHWGQTNLRRMSTEVGLKDLYDKYYDWSSAFVHGNWAALRSSQYGICANPLHRFHRLLSESDVAQSDVIPDAAELTNLILEITEKFYPGVDRRL